MKLLLGIALVLSFTVFPTTALADLPASPSPSPTASPAPTGLVHWAHRWERVALHRLELLNRARRCFGLPALHRPLWVLPRRADAVSWRELGRGYREAAQKYHRQFQRLRHRMTHPRGSGWERWRPLVRWHWPAPLVETALRIIHYESGGNPSVRNYQGSGAAGLFQLLPAPDGWANPDTNVWYAYHRKYVPAGGWSPWAGCRAF